MVQKTGTEKNNPETIVCYIFTYSESVVPILTNLKSYFAFLLFYKVNINYRIFFTLEVVKSCILHCAIQYSMQ